MTAPAKPARTRIVVENPADGGVLYWIVRFYAFAAIALCAGGVYVHCMAGVSRAPTVVSDSPALRLNLDLDLGLILVPS